MVSPFKVPVTLASLPASFSSELIAALSLVSRVYTLSPTTRAYLEPLLTHAFVQSASEPDIMWALPHMASLTLPLKLWALSAANTVAQTNSAARKIPNFCERDFMWLSPENVESAPGAHPSKPEGYLHRVSERAESYRSADIFPALPQPLPDRSPPCTAHPGSNSAMSRTALFLRQVDSWSIHRPCRFDRGFRRFRA